MRLQVRVTPAYQELMDHLESIEPEYRGKRLVVLAAMQLAGAVSEHSAGAPERAGTAVFAGGEVSASTAEPVKPRPDMGWITRAGKQQNV